MLAYAGMIPPAGSYVNSATVPPRGVNAASNRHRGYLAMDDAAAIAWRIQIARLARGLAQRELGVKLGISKQAVTNMETGDRGISPERLKEIATALGVSESYLSLGITQASDIKVITEGARQAGWDEAVRRMRVNLDELTSPNHNNGGATTRRRARVTRPDEDEPLPNPATQRKRKPA